MSEGEYEKLRTHLRLLTISVVIFALLALASLIHTFVNPKTTSFPKVQVINGKDGVSPKIDYDKVNAYIQQQIAQIPIPQNGANGQSIIGPSGVGTQGATGNQGSPGIGTIGAQGNPGLPGKQIELQYNTIKHQTEWRYVGDFTWQVLFQNCQILETC